MINNRQNGRRRGRGGGPRPTGGGPNPGNRQDNRSRGNAAQLHEKYKSLARDAQMGGDRVQTEYYLQFADHYFRVLSENRPRFEEQRPRHGDFTDEDEDGDDNLAADGDDDDGGPVQQPQRFERQDRDRGPREPRPAREAREPRETREPREHREARPAREPREQREPRYEGGEPERAERSAPERNGADRNSPDRNGPDRNGDEPMARRMRPRRDRNEERGPQPVSADQDGGDERISMDVLPPAIAPIGEVDEIKPRRRTRRPRADGDTDIAPAA